MDQIRNIICYNNLPVIIAGGYGGLSDSSDGASHQSLIDVAIFRAMPNMSVLVPGDPIEVKESLQIALEMKSPVYIRLARNPSPVLFEGKDMMKYGEIRKIREGEDLTIAVCGIPVYMAIRASKILADKGISCEILQVSSIKPLDHKTLVKSVKKTGRLLTIEEHSVIGGLGGAICESLGRIHPVKMDIIGIDDRFTESGPYYELLTKYGISIDNIVDKAISLIK
jgi:transketolase